MTDVHWVDTPAPRAANGSERLEIEGVDYTDELNDLGFYIVRDNEAVVDGEAWSLRRVGWHTFALAEHLAPVTDDADDWLAEHEAHSTPKSDAAYEAYWQTVQRIRRGDYRTEAQVTADDALTDALFPDEEPPISVDLDDELPHPLRAVGAWILSVLGKVFPMPEFTGEMVFDVPTDIVAADDALADAGFIFDERALILNTLATALPGLFDEPSHEY